MWLKWTKRIVAGIGILVVLMIGLLVAIAYLFEDEIKKYALEKLNAQLTVPVDVEEIDLTLLDKFPQASLRFTNAYIPDIRDTNDIDTLIFAENIYLNFNIWDMIDGNYQVQEIDVDNSILKVGINEKGEENYVIWQKDTSSAENQFSFKLEEVEFSDLNFSYLNEQSDQLISFFSDEFYFQGNFTNSSYNLACNSELFINKFDDKEVTYISNKNSNLDLNLNINSDSSLYTINKGDLEIEDLAFKVSGRYSNIEDSSYLDLFVRGFQIDLESSYSIFPQKFFSKLIDYKSIGKVDFESRISGRIDKEHTPEVKADFSLIDGSLTEKNTGAQLSQINLTGSYESSNKRGVQQVNIPDISAAFGSDRITGSLSVENFNKPKISTKLSGSTQLELIEKFFNSEYIDILKGKTEFDIDLSTTILDPENINKGTIRISKAIGNIHFQDGVFKSMGSHIRLSDLEGSISLQGKNAKINQLNGVLIEDEFKSSGYISNLWPYVLTPNEHLSLSLNLNSKHIDLDRILDSGESSGESEPLHLPERLNLKIQTSLDELKYGKFTASKFKAKTAMQDHKIKVSNVYFKANKGSYNGKAELEELGSNQFFLHLDVNASKVDISNFFEEMDDFGQSIVTYKNIKGTTSTDLSLAMALDGFMNIDLNRLIASAKIKVKDGELIEQPTLLDIADYLGENAITKRVLKIDKFKKKLKTVKFDDLEQNIIVKDGKIEIPRMTVSSNVMNIGITGTHSFDDVVDYHFNFRIRDVLLNKNEDEFGPIIDDDLGVRLFLHVYGPLSNLNYKLDKEEKKLKRQKDIEEEKKELKSILKDEFGLFRKDSTIQTRQEEKKPDPTFEVEWEEFDNLKENSEEVEEEEKKRKKKEKKNRGAKLKEKLGITEGNNDEPEVEFEIDH